MTTPTKNFLGIPIEGDINQAGSKVPQRPLSELEPLIRAVLEDPTIKAFGWSQYTPYFNDGDPCVFRVSDVWVLTDQDPEPGEWEEGEDEFYVDTNIHPSLGGQDYRYTGGVFVYEPYRGPDEARYNRVKALATAINSNAFNNVLLQAFGDHAEVIVRASGITVDTYEHD